MRVFFFLLLLFTPVLTPSAWAYQERPAEFPTYTAHVNGISIAYQDFGNPANDTILLVMGLGGQLIHWDNNIVTQLVDAGYRVVRFDNRDAGWSEKFYNAPTPGLTTALRFKLGMPLNSPYKLNDMAADANALLEYLGVKRAHVVGMSMGGMIAQIMAAKYTERVVSLTSIMSTTSAAHLPQGSIQLEPRSGQITRAEHIARSVKIAKLVDGNIAEPTEEEWIKMIARGHPR